MRSFVKNLTEQQKEDFKSFLQMRGVSHLLEWVVLRKVACKENASLRANDWEEVLRLRGEIQGYDEVLSFINSAKESLRDFQQKD